MLVEKKNPSVSLFSNRPPTSTTGASQGSASSWSCSVEQAKGLHLVAVHLLRAPMVEYLAFQCAPLPRLLPFFLDFRQVPPLGRLGRAALSA